MYLRAPARGDFQAWARVRDCSRAFLEPWEPVWAEDDLTRRAYIARIDRFQLLVREGLGLALFLVERSNEQLLGGITLTNIRRGATQSGTLGYWMGVDFAGRGFMAEAAGATIDFAFDLLKLHRIEAASMPENDRSVRLLKRLGFVPEGLARNYIQVNGRRRDHLLFSLLENDPRQTPSGRARLT